MLGPSLRHELCFLAKWRLARAKQSETTHSVMNRVMQLHSLKFEGLRLHTIFSLNECFTSDLVDQVTQVTPGVRQDDWSNQSIGNQSELNDSDSIIDIAHRPDSSMLLLLNLT